MNRCRLYCVWGWLLLLTSVGLAQVSADFEAANKLFEQGQFAAAASSYDRLLTNSPTAALHFNLANARFKSGQPGQAIYHYHAALRLTPRDPDIRANLAFIRRSLGVTVEEQFGHHWLRKHTLDEWAKLAGVGLGAWFLLLALGEALPARRPAFAWLTKILGLGAVLLTTQLALAHWERANSQRAVVIAPEVPVRPGPLAESKSTFALRDGTEVRVIDTKADWLQVRDGQQRVGWISSNAARALP